MNTKSFSGLRVKDAAEGEFTAVFSTFNVIDRDGDVTRPGAFEDGTEVRISAYGHASWGGVLPVGKGLIHSNDTEAWVDGQFFMDTDQGKNTFLTVKAMGALQEWSYSVHPTKNSFGEFEGQRVQFLEKLAGPDEVSPVLKGAGLRTRTLTTKDADPTPFKRGIPVHETAVVCKAWDGLAVVAGIAADARPSELRSIYAWVDPNGDPETKTSYRFPHHMGVKGPANVRACLAGIASLNRNTDLPDAGRKAAYDHLAAHLKDADREPPELRTAPGAAVKFNDELVEGLAGLSDLIDSATRVVALRAEKGKTLSRVNAEILEWIRDDLKRLDALLTNPIAGTVSDEDLTATYLASLARIHNL